MDDADEKAGAGGASEVPQVAGRKAKRKKRRGRPQKKATNNEVPSAQPAKYPRHSLDKALRIPKAILEQNAGKDCTDEEAAAFVGVGYNGPFQVELSSASKYGLLERPNPGTVKVADVAKQIIRPQSPSDELRGKRAAALSAPVIGEVYKHYRGENIPDQKFFDNALVDKFRVPADKTVEFTQIFVETMQSAQLIEQQGAKYRLLDVSSEEDSAAKNVADLEKLGKAAQVTASDSCFVMMPFAAPTGNYYSLVYEPAIRRAGLHPIRADADIFGSGKIMDQIWSGIRSAKVLVAELTSRNPNVFYELGLAHALRKPVVLVSSGEADVPFDLQHIRVIYYDVTDPFWGEKLIKKVAENILSALNNPDEAIFERAVS